MDATEYQTKKYKELYQNRDSINFFYVWKGMPLKDWVNLPLTYYIVHLIYKISIVYVN
jgi:hypothetical protein